MSAPWIFFPVDKAVFKSSAEIQGNEGNSGICMAKTNLDRKGRYQDYTFVYGP